MSGGFSSNPSSHGAGVAIGSVSTGLLMDRLYAKEKARVGGDHRTEPAFRLERTRMGILPVHAVICLASAIALGWTMYYRVHVAVPIILNFIFGLGTAITTVATIIGIDLMTGQGGAVTASFNFTRCLCGAVEVGTVQLINRRMGPGWMFVLLSGLCLLATPLPIIVWKKGPAWRAKRNERLRRKEEAEAEAASQAASQASEGGLS